MTTMPNHADTYRSLGQLEGRIEGLEEKIDTGFSSIHDKIDKALTDHEDRIRVVEKVQTEQAGGWKLLTIIGAIAAGVGGLIASAWSILFGGHG